MAHMKTPEPIIFYEGPHTKDVLTNNSVGWCASQFQDSLLSYSPAQVGVNPLVCVSDSNLLAKLCKDFNIWPWV